MGAIRGILLVFVAVLLFLSVLLANLFLVLTLSLNYENVREESTTLVKDFLKEIDITNALKQAYPLISFYCQNYSEYVFNYQGYTLDIPCSIVSQGENAIIEEGVRDLVKSVYYAKYECNFLDCPNKSQLPLFLISEKAHDFWENKFYLSLIISFVLFILVFLLVEKKTNALILSGSLLIVSAVPFIKLDYLLSLFSDKIIFKFLGVFFSQAYYVSIKTLVIGIGLLVLGIVLDIFKVGFFISNLISKSKEKTSKKTKKSKSK